MRVLPTPVQTILAVARGYLPRLFQGRGIAMAATIFVPIALVSILLGTVKREGELSTFQALTIFHQAVVPFLLPILSIFAAPAGIREDIEQRTLPLMLVRPIPVWSLPVAKGLPWFGWGALWLVISASLLTIFGIDLERLVRIDLALVMAFWAQLAFMTFLTLTFKRGTLWGAIFLFTWDPAVWLMPSNIQRLTFLHYVESIAGSRGAKGGTLQLLTQAQISTPEWISVLVLFGVGCAFWAAAGMRIQHQALGLAGREAEG